MKIRRFRGNRLGSFGAGQGAKPTRADSAHPKRDRGTSTPSQAISRLSLDSLPNDLGSTTASDIDGVLIERVRTLWQVGDWRALLSIDWGSVEKHPLRAQLAALIATAEFQIGDGTRARKLVEQAESWGCPRELLLRGLMAGSLNSLGRLHALRGRFDRAERNFSAALATGFPGSDHPLTALVRANSQYQQIGLSGGTSLSAINAGESRYWPSDSGSKNSGIVPTEDHPTPDLVRYPDFAPLEALLSTGTVTATALLNEGEKEELISQMNRCMHRVLAEPPAVKLTIESVQTTRATLHLAHVLGDYIPTKVLREKKFYEADFLEVIEFFVDPGTVILDIGANIGNHSLFFAKVLGATVHAFEPEPHNIVCLEVNLALNGASDRVKVHRHAVGSAEGDIILTMSNANNFGSFSASPDSNPNRKPDERADSRTVAVDTVDSSLSDLYSDVVISVLKIDVEGMELEVLRGAANVLERHHPMVACECFDQTEFSRVEGFLVDFEYFPILMRNATPTFLFISTRNDYHMSRLANFLRREALTTAAKRPGFALKSLNT